MNYFIKVIILLCTILQPGYFQEKYIYQPSSATGQYGGYWPFQIQTQNGNYNTSPRRHKKPCTRRMNSEDPNSGLVQSDWVPTYTSRVVKPLEQNNVMFTSRSLKDKDFTSTSSTTTEKVTTTSSTTTEEQLVQTDSKLPMTIYDNICGTGTTTEEVAYKSQSDYDQVGPNYDYHDEVEDNNEGNLYEQDYKSDESPEDLPEDCNKGLETGGNPRRFLSPPGAFDAEQGGLNSNDADVKKGLLDQNNNAIAPNDNSPESQINDRRGSHHFNASIPKSNAIENKLMEPTKGRGISQMPDSRVMLMHNSKVCYACSSVSDPTCWKPDRRTTLKYCRVGHDSCVTKTIRNPNGLITIRDCAHSCDDTDATGLIPRYKSCSICHYDLCNGAFTIKIYNFMLLSTFLALIKYSLV